MLPPTPLIASTPDRFLWSISPDLKYLLALLPLVIVVAIIGEPLARGRSALLPIAAADPAATLGLTMAVAAIVTLTILPRSQSGRFVQLLPVVPFVTEVGRHPVGAIADVLGNVLLFVPMGFLGARRWVTIASTRKVIMVAASVSLVIEALQFAMGNGHTASTDDVLADTLGAVLGYGLLLFTIRTSSSAGPDLSGYVSGWSRFSSGSLKLSVDRKPHQSPPARRER